MNLLENYYKKVIKPDLINKFNYNKSEEIPQLKKITLNFECKGSELKKLGASILALELITERKGILTRAKKSNISLKIRKGHPVGCALTLKKKQMYNFFLVIASDILPNLRDFKGIFVNKKKKPYNSITLTIKELILFSSLESNFYLFSNLPNLNITITTNTKNQNELIYLIDSLKIPTNSKLQT